jgi:GNAT superfamily N-acetyltransferase
MVANVEQARIDDAPEVFALIQRCRLNLEKKSIFQWYDGYPTLKDVEKDALGGSLYVIRSGDKIFAAACLNDEQPDEYTGIAWKFNEGRAFVAHRICVDPDHEGKGLGRTLMEYAERLAKSNGCSCIRLDAYTGNPRSAEFYERLGYSVAGQVFFPGRSLPFNCLEKPLP